MKHWFKKSAWLLAGSLICTPAAIANDFSASFKGTDIQEFINIVGRNLEKTIIVDPSVRGKIDVRSYDVLNEETILQLLPKRLRGLRLCRRRNGLWCSEDH